MHALRGYGALFRAAISGGNVVRGHAIAEQLSGTRVRVRRQVRAGLWEGGKHRLMRMVGGSGSNGADMAASKSKAGHQLLACRTKTFRRAALARVAEWSVSSVGGKPPERVKEMPGGVNSETRAYRCPTAGDSDAVSRSQHTVRQQR